MLFIAGAILCLAFMDDRIDIYSLLDYNYFLSFINVEWSWLSDGIIYCLMASIVMECVLESILMRLPYGVFIVMECVLECSNATALWCGS